MNGTSLSVVVPARGGSLRVPGKNLRHLAGRPLLCHTLELIRAAGLQDRAIVSSDDARTLELAATFGVRPLERPAHLATATASTEAVLVHALDVLEGEGETPEWVVTLPPTSPFRRAETLRGLLERVAARPADQDCLMTVTEERRDFWRMDSDGVMARIFPDAPRRQQDRTPLFDENSAVYVTRTAALRATGSVLGKVVRGVVVDALEAWDINTEIDFAIAEFLAETSISTGERRS